MKFIYSVPFNTVYANDNSAYNPQLWAQESLALLNDEYGRDRVIREQFEMQKKDEKVIIILDKDSRTTADLEVETDNSFFARIKNFIVNIFSRD